jgi:hypothetical protein
MLRVLAAPLDGGWQPQVQRSLQGMSLVALLVLPLVLGTAFTAGTFAMQLQTGGVDPTLLQGMPAAG